MGVGKRSFWEAKSRDVYKWGRPSESDAYPWIQFLGYQIRYDGAVRVRQSSVAKELTKLTQNTGRLLDSLCTENLANIRRSPSSITRSIRMKLISMGIGRRRLGQSLAGPQPKSWANGFRWLLGKNALIYNLRALDRQRERQVSRVVRRLRGLGMAETPVQRRRYGFPFSYVGQFLRPGK